MFSDENRDQDLSGSNQISGKSLYGHLKVSKALLPCHGIFRNFWESMGGERNAG